MEGLAAFQALKAMPIIQLYMSPRGAGLLGLTMCLTALPAML
jgi:hypothetical protein